MAYTVILDPSAVSTGRAQFNINTGGIRVAGAGIDWGDAAIEAFLADLKYGSVPVDYRVPNRQVTIPLAIFTTEDGATIEETVRRQLSEKVALFHSEGGALQRQRTVSGVPMYADVVDASFHIPDTWGETGAIEPDINLVPQCLPDFYGDEVSSDIMTGTQFVDAVLQQGGVNAVVAGDYPARTRIVVTDTSGHDQHGLFWAFRSRYWASGDWNFQARLVRNATQLAVLNGSTLVNQTGTVGGKVIQNTFVSDQGWLPIVEVSTATNGALTHKGTYRVYVRVQGVANPTQLQLFWQPGTLTSIPEMNDPVYIPGDATVGESGTNYYILDLGEVRIDPPLLSGASGWFGAIQALCDPGNTQTVSIDSVYFLPLDDGAGRLSVVSSTPTFAAATTSVDKSTPGTEADNSAVGSGATPAWTIPATFYTGNRAEAGSAIGTVQTHYYVASNWGFSIPGTATILGIQVGIQRRKNGSGTVNDKILRITKDVTGALTVLSPGKSQSGNWPSSATWQYYGASNDLWGQTLAPADVNNAHFGFALQAKIVATGSGCDAIIKAVSMSVFYQLASGLIVAQDAVVYANETCEIRTEGAYRVDAAGTNPLPVRIQEGETPRLPPSLQEGRVTEVFVDTSRGDLDQQPDTNLDSLSVQVFWRPCYIERP